MNNTKSKTKKQKQVKDLQILPICFYGHKRTKLAVLAIQRLKKHLKMTGYEPRFIFGNCGTDKKYAKAVKEAAGDWLYKTIQGKPFMEGDTLIHNELNDSMNKTLQEAFKLSPVVLRLEDDFIMEKDLDIGPWCDLLMEDEMTAGVRLGQIQIDPKQVKPYREDLGLDWLDYQRNARYPVNNQIFAVHKRLYDVVGWYSPAMSIDEAEFDFGRRFRVKMGSFEHPEKCLKVLWPHGQPVDLEESPNRIFVHAGASTLGHVHFTEAIPERYLQYQE